MKCKFGMSNKFFSFGMSVFLIFFIIACSSSSSPPPTYTISGTVTGAVAGITINLTGAATASTTTDANGNYSFTVTNGSYNVTPSSTSYTFTPVSSVVAVSGASVTNVNFAATASTTTNIISGTVSGAVLANVVITLTGSDTGSTLTNASGNYSFSPLANGSYTVTASLTGYTFSSPISGITLSGTTNSSGNNFTATAVIPPASTYSISGTVSGALAGITINLTGAATHSTTTDGSGNYIFGGLANGSYTVAPSSTSYTFTPNSTGVIVNGANMPGVNFTASPISASTYSISGTVSGGYTDGVTITLGGAGSGTTTTNASGNYSFSGLVNGSYTVTPTLTGYTFSPTSLSPAVSSANVTNQNFTAAIVPATQADLTGTWIMHNLKTGSSAKWMYAEFTFDSSGNASCSYLYDSGGATTCSGAGTFAFTVNSTTGVITSSGSGGPTAHFLATMTSNGQLIVGTDDNGLTPPTDTELVIMQKVVPGTTYTSADVANLSLVIHGLSSTLTGDPFWTYAAGTTDGSGNLTITSDTNSQGPSDTGAQGTLSVDGSGNVTLSGATNFHGFLSADKKTIVMTDSNTNGSGTYNTMNIGQVAGRTYTAGPAPAGISTVHFVSEVDFTNSPDFDSPATPYAFWMDATQTITSGGAYTFSNVTSSNPLVTSITGGTASITSSGTVTTTANSTYNGQVSDDGRFTVGTETDVDGDGNNWYMLIVHTQ
jgi:hypothetical protein